MHLIPSDYGVINIETMRIPAEIEKLERFKLPYVIIDFNSIEEKMYAIELIGPVIGKKKKAQTLNN